MAKKEKTIEQYRKGYKRRGIFYIVMIVLLIIATVLVNIDGVEKGFTKAFYPKSMEIKINGKKETVYSELSEEEGIDLSSYYILDENGEKQYVRASSFKDDTGSLVLVNSQFKTRVSMIYGLIKGLVRFFLILFAILLIIYLIRFSYYLSNKDEEWRSKASDKMTGIRVKFDKFFTKADEGIKKIGKKK